MHVRTPKAHHLLTASQHPNKKSLLVNASIQINNLNKDIPQQQIIFLIDRSMSESDIELAKDVIRRVISKLRGQHLYSILTLDWDARPHAINAKYHDALNVLASIQAEQQPECHIHFLDQKALQVKDWSNASMLLFTDGKNISPLAAKLTIKNLSADGHPHFFPVLLSEEEVNQELLDAFATKTSLPQVVQIADDLEKACRAITKLVQPHPAPFTISVHSGKDKKVVQLAPLMFNQPCEYVLEFPLPKNQSALTLTLQSPLQNEDCKQTIPLDKLATDRDMIARYAYQLMVEVNQKENDPQKRSRCLVETVLPLLMPEEKQDSDFVIRIRNNIRSKILPEVNEIELVNDQPVELQEYKPDSLIIAYEDLLAELEEQEKFADRAQLKELIKLKKELLNLHVEIGMVLDLAFKADTVFAMDTKLYFDRSLHNLRFSLKHFDHSLLTASQKILVKIAAFLARR